MKSKRNKLADRLARFGSHLSGGPVRSAPEKARLPDRYTRMAKALGGKIVSNAAGHYCLVRTVYGPDYLHGNTELADCLGNTDVPKAAFNLKDTEGVWEMPSLLFFDTETTGLGGAGTVPFLIGCGSLSESGLEVRQYIIPDYGDEAAMLEDVLEEFTAEQVPVTYNGASFDLPILKDRMIINRVAREIKTDGSIDLLHSARRLFKRRLADCTLGNIERQLLGFHRQDDVPGYLVPSIYFEWLSSEDLSALPGVLEHNRLDIVSLLFLLVTVARAYQSEGQTLDRTDDLHSLSKFFGRKKNHQQAANICNRLQQEEGNVLADDIVWYQAQVFKRTGQLDRAVPLWEKLTESSGRESYLANLELAKHHEHRTKDIDIAMRYARAAKAAGVLSIRQKELLYKRVTRLSLKLKG